jgi:DNA mismatch endonuclease (patch repair protein)
VGISEKSRKFRVPKSNQVYWEGKIRRNQSRDGEINLQLEKLGWRVLRIWESSLQDEEAVAAKLSRVM